MTKRKTKDGEPFGRPTDYKPEYCEELVGHMKKGHSFRTFAATVPDISVCEKTLYNWTESNPDFLQAKKKGEVASEKYWEDKCLQIVEGDLKGTSASMAMFTMKCRFGYIDSFVDVSSIPSAQMIEMVEKAMAKLKKAKND